MVRRAAGGNETVAAAVVGAMNPAASMVVELARRLVPGAIDPERVASGWTGARVAQWVSIWTVVAASFAADLTGHAALSWALDAGAVAAYLAFRVARRRT